MTLPMDQVRAAFPALALADDGLPRLYLDAPAGTQVAGRVVEAMSRTMIEACANDGGTFRTSVATGAIVEAALAAAAPPASSSARLAASRPRRSSARARAHRGGHRQRGRRSEKDRGAGRDDARGEALLRVGDAAVDPARCDEPGESTEAVGRVVKAHALRGVFAVAELRCSARSQNSRSSAPGKSARSFCDWCLKIAVRLRATSSGESGTAISVCSTSHSCQAPR